MSKKALLVVDMQNDFLPNGALGVEFSDEIIPLINQMVKLPFDVRIASKDFHPPGHCSFASTWGKKPGECILIGNVEQTLWPDHCVQGTWGAEISSQLDASHFDLSIHKGMDPKVDSYSVFYDQKKHRSTGLEDVLREGKVTDLYLAGLTTEYCVFYSCLDAIDLGFKTHVILDACRGVDLRPGDVETALRRMIEHGAELVTTEQVVKRIGG